MTNMTVIDSGHNFGSLHAAMRRYVDQEILAGVSSAVLAGRDLIDVHYSGWADREADVTLGAEHIFRVFSNTKLVTSYAVLLLYQEDRFQLDDPIERFIPQMGDRRVLRPGATDPDNTEPAARSITIRHLMTHSSGLSYGLIDDGSVIFELYSSNKVKNPALSLSDLIEVLASLPLAFHPGTSWEYSYATDVLAHLVEIVSGQSFGDFLKARIFGPLGMADTDFQVPPEKIDRLAVYYAGADLMDPMKGGLTPSDDMLVLPQQSGGGGLFSTLPDMVALIRSLIPGDGMLLLPESMALIKTNQLRDGLHLRFPGIMDFPGKGHGVASAVSLAPLPNEPPAVVGEYYWSGVAGTQWWVSPHNNLAGVVMTQRRMASLHPFAAELKKLTYDAVVT